MEAKYKVSVNGVEQAGEFSADELGMKVGVLVSLMGGCEIKVERVKDEPSKEFKVGEEYYCRSLCDHNCIYRCTVKKRTEKSVWIDSTLGNGMTDRRCKVNVDSEGVEYIIPERYSCAPVFRASRVADGVHDVPDWC